MGKISEEVGRANRNFVRGNLPEGTFVITYDDGPHAVNTLKLMDLWNKSGLAKPSFFRLSHLVQKHENIVSKAVTDKFDIALHSERHLDLGNISKSIQKSDLNRVNRDKLKPELASIPDSGPKYIQWRDSTLNREIILAANTINTVVRKFNPNYKLKSFRLPFGSGVRNTRLGNRLQQVNLDHYYWAVDSLDWQDKNPESVFARVTNQMLAAKRGRILS